MARNYYYFVAGLPDILLDQKKNVPPFDLFIEEAHGEMAHRDIELLSIVRLPFDNKNCVAMLESNDSEFDTRGNFTKDQLAAEIKFPETIPEYMQVYIESFKEKKELFPGYTPLDQLEWLFYDWAMEHRNRFIREWFTFDLNLRNLLIGINSRKELEHIDALNTDRERSVSSLIVCRNDVAGMILRSTAADFGVTQMLPWSERIFRLAKGSTIEFEKGIDTLRWDMLNDLTIATYFQIETILAFTLKLIIAERWLKLEPETGKLQLDRLVNELTSSYTMPAGF